jgi:hypothetical protein
MRRFRRLASFAALGLPLLLSGCWVISTNRRLPVPKAPSIVQSVTPDVLVAQMNQRWASLDTMTAKVEIQASVLKTKQGVATDYTTVGGNKRRQHLHAVHSFEEDCLQGLRVVEEEIGQPTGEFAARLLSRRSCSAGARTGRFLFGDLGL